MTGFLAFIVVFSLLVFVHEFGHFAVAKLCGVRVEEFGFGYPPRLVKLGNWRETEITLNVLPFGGFVRMGEDDPSTPGSLATRRAGVRVLVYSSGALMNVVLAIVLFTITFMVGALTPVEGNGAGIYYVSPMSPAEEAGLAPGDTLLRINGEKVVEVQDAIDLIQANLGEPTEIVVRRNGQELPPLVATPREEAPEGEGELGVALDLPLERRSYPIWRAVPMGIQSAFGTVASIFYGIQAAIAGDMPLEVSGPIGIYRQTTQVAQTGLQRLLEFTGFLSMNLFLLNLLPLPALDGGRLVFVLLETLRGGKRIPPEKEGLVHAIGMVLIIGLMLVVTVMDVQRYFG